MNMIDQSHSQMRQAWRNLILLLCAFVAAPTTASFAQFLDQGAITGTVQDGDGGAIPGAIVKLEQPESGFNRSTTADKSGNYIFSPLKIGLYTITVTAPGFENSVQKNISLSQGQRLEISPKLKLGSVSETITVTEAPPLLQSQESSVGQVLTTQEINETPLNGRNAMYLVQLTAGAAPSSGSRGAGTGDFDANGLRPEQNNFVIDGVDNNAQSVDFLGASSYLINPPPDALAEFKVSTSNYSAEFGHSAGAVVSASIKSGTNQIHGDLWEYWRNDILNSRDWVNSTAPKGKYRQNQFGATLGGPVLKDKVFLFGDVQATRIVINLAQQPITVPTVLERAGNFTELLANKGALNSGGAPITLYQPHNNQVPLACNGVANVLCQNQIDPVAQTLLNLYPLPNANNGATYSNYAYSLNQPSNTFQWDTRADWNISSKDQAFARFSYLNQRGTFAPPLGPILDGSCSTATTCNSGTKQNYANNFVISETHIFTPRLVNDFRVAFNYARFGLIQQNYDQDFSQRYGLGGVPFGPDTPSNGALPFFTISGANGLQNFGTRGFRPEKERQNVYQILDNVSYTHGSHSVRMGFSYQSIRSYTLEPPASRPQYTYTGAQTAKPGIANTGSGIADFLTNNMSNGAIGPYAAFNDAQNNISGYAQDDWRVTQNLTLNLGVRYDYFQPAKEMAGRQGNFYVSSVGVSTGTGVYKLPAQSQGTALNPAFLALLAKDNITLQYDPNPRLAQQHNLNFSPRVGFALTTDPTTVFRGGFGLFYQGQQPMGAADNLGFNYPFLFTNNFPAPGCSTGAASCASNGYTLEKGFSDALSQGLTTYFSTPTLVGQSIDMKTTYAMSYNLTFEKAITPNLVATMAYVGTGSRHLPVALNSNSQTVLTPSGSDSKAFTPFPDLGGSTNVLYAGISKYNGLQTKIQQRFAHGLTFLSTYTWSHSMDDATEGLGGGVGGYRDPNVIPIRQDFTNSGWDTRHRFTFNGSYVLPFGRGQSHLSHASGLVDALLGGWVTNVTYQLQSGQPFSVGSSNQTNVAGGTTYAILRGNPFAPGGTPDPTNPNITCPTSVRNKAHWYNPCAFANPLPSSLLTPIARNGGNPNTPAPGFAYPSFISNTATAKLFLGGVSNQVYGPGFQRLDMSLSKRFHTFEGQYFEFRGDGFNMLNTPAYANPSTTNIGQNGGQITSARTVQAFTPNGRFFQLAAKYVF